MVHEYTPSKSVHLIGCDTDNTTVTIIADIALLLSDVGHEHRLNAALRCIGGIETQHSRRNCNVLLNKGDIPTKPIQETIRDCSLWWCRTAPYWIKGLYVKFELDICFPHPQQSIHSGQFNSIYAAIMGLKYMPLLRYFPARVWLYCRPTILAYWWVELCKGQLYPTFNNNTECVQLSPWNLLV